ncbi:MAG: hypothetical protein OXI10_04355 [Gammaproteobacteria bacterium]|nr:hypothetical protein [Gammaproteobacteria bacterium]
MLKSRRIGISWGEALGAVRKVAPDQGAANVYYQSYAKDMTAGFIADCADWAEWYAKVGKTINEEVFEEDGRKFYTYRIEAATGKTIQGMTSSPRGFRSKGRPGDHAIIDEAAFVDDLGAVLKAARAFKIWKGQIRIISTHNGEQSEFAQLCNAIREGTKPGVLHTVTFKDALKQGLYKKICEITGEEWSPEKEAEWEAEVRADYGEDAAEELDCIPASGAGHWLSWPLIHRAEHADAGNPDLYQQGTCYIGVDVARRRDLWVAWVLELLGDVFWTREIVELRNETFATQDAVLDELVARYRPVRIKMDQTGMGEKPVEDAKRRYGDLRTEGVIMTNPARLDVATAFRELFEDSRIRIPLKNVKLRADLRSVRTEEAPGGGVRILSPRTKEGKGEDKNHAEKTHADRFWAGALAAAAGAGMAGPFDGAAVPMGTGVSQYGLDLDPGDGTGGVAIDYDRGVVISPTAHEMNLYG